MNNKWGVFSADLNPVIGSEQRRTRSVIVVSDEDFNVVMPVVTVLPVTSLKEDRKVYPNEVLLTKGAVGLSQDSLVLAHQIRTISKQRIKDNIGFVNRDSVRETINDALRVHLNL